MVCKTALLRVALAQWALDPLVNWLFKQPLWGVIFNRAGVKTVQTLDVFPDL
jgi:hypothetical protein